MNVLFLAKTVAVTLCVAAVWALWNSYTDGLIDRGYKKAVAEYSEKTRIAKEEAEAVRKELSKVKDQAEKERTNHEKVTSGYRNELRSAFVRLRDTERDLNEYVAGAPIETCRKTAETGLRLFRTCTERYQDVAERASGHLADAELFEKSWPVSDATLFKGP